MTNTEKFTATRVEWNYRPLNAIGSPPGATIRTNPKIVDGRCNACGKTFTAFEGGGPGKFMNTVGGPGYTCECGNAGTIDIGQFA
jgi:hypothetical protein